MKKLESFALFLLLLLCLYSCDLPVIDPVISKYSLRILGSNNLTGFTGETLSAIEMKVVDENNNPVPNLELNVMISSGSVDDNQPITDNQGIASVIWTLGDTPGEQTMTISSTELANNPQQVTAMVNQISYNLAIVSGEQQFNATTGKPLDDPFVVQIIDPASSTAVSGVVVRFDVIEGNASFAGSMSTNVPTNVEGRASATLTMGGDLLDTVLVQARLASSSQVISEPESVQFSSGTTRFTDERDGQTYGVVRLLDGNIWTAENLNYTLEDSWCYNDNPISCNEYGRLYTWESALEACPPGWHLPTDEEWREMAKKYGGAHPDATDDGEMAFDALINGGTSGFNARLGGYWQSGVFYFLGNGSLYWSVTQSENNSAESIEFLASRRYLGIGAIPKSVGVSVRCLQD